MWIDADSCKPKQDTDVLIAYDDVIDIGHWTGKGWQTGRLVGIDVKAWQPLPEPYYG